MREHREARGPHRAPDPRERPVRDPGPLRRPHPPVPGLPPAHAPAPGRCRGARPAPGVPRMRGAGRSPRRLRVPSYDNFHNDDVHLGGCVVGPGGRAVPSSSRSSSHGPSAMCSWGGPKVVLSKRALARLATLRADPAPCVGPSGLVLTGGTEAAGRRFWTWAGFKANQTLLAGSAKAGGGPRTRSSRSRSVWGRARFGPPMSRRRCRS